MFKVSLANIRFHPDSEHLVSAMSGRVHPFYQGRGFGNMVNSPLTTYLVKEYPLITRFVEDTMCTPNIEAKMKIWKLLYRWVGDRNLGLSFAMGFFMLVQLRSTTDQDRVDALILPSVKSDLLRTKSLRFQVRGQHCCKCWPYTCVKSMLKSIILMAF